MSDREETGFSNRSLLINTSESELENIEEAALLAEYKSILGEMNLDQRTLFRTRQILDQMSTHEIADMGDTKSSLELQMTRARRRINRNDSKLLSLERNPVLMAVIKREKQKAYKAAEEAGQEALERYRTQIAQKTEEQLNTYREQLAESARVRALARHTAEKQATNEKLNEKINSLKVVTTWVRLATIALVVILLCSLSWLAEDVYAQPYQISTYVCYTTQYGDCYHADYCGSLWNSSYKTTVYHAQQQGYRFCSRCSPYEQTTITLEEPASKWLIFLVGGSGIVLVYFMTTAFIQTKIKNIKAQINNATETAS